MAWRRDLIRAAGNVGRSEPARNATTRSGGDDLLSVVWCPETRRMRAASRSDGTRGVDGRNRGVCSAIPQTRVRPLRRRGGPVYVRARVRQLSRDRPRIRRKSRPKGRDTQVNSRE